MCVCVCVCVCVMVVSQPTHPVNTQFVSASRYEPRLLAKGNHAVEHCLLHTVTCVTQQRRPPTTRISFLQRCVCVCLIAEINCGVPGPIWNGYLDGHRTTVGAVYFYRYVIQDTLDHTRTHAHPHARTHAHTQTHTHTHTQTRAHTHRHTQTVFTHTHTHTHTHARTHARTRTWRMDIN